MIGSGRRGNRTIVLIQAFRRGLVVVRRHRQQALRSGALHPQPDVNDLAGVVASSPGEHRNVAGGFVDNELDDADRSSSVSVGLSPVVPHGTRK